MRFADVIFCDDIRFEVGNKASYIGVYVEDAKVPDFPHTFPKLCAVINAKTGAEDPFQSLIFRIFINGQEQTYEIPEQDLNARQQGALFENTEREEAEDDDLQHTLQFLVRAVFPHLRIESEGRIKVRVETEREVLRAGTLLIRQENDEDG